MASCNYSLHPRGRGHSPLNCSVSWTKHSRWRPRCVGNYAVYNERGIILRRVDLVGESHKGVDTPHVQKYLTNETPDGRVFPYQADTASPTGPGDVPPIRC